jgi:hypothetical protein
MLNLARPWPILMSRRSPTDGHAGRNQFYHRDSRSNTRRGIWLVDTQVWHDCRQSNLCRGSHRGRPKDPSQRKWSSARQPHRRSAEIIATTTNW